MLFARSNLRIIRNAHIKHNDCIRLCVYLNIICYLGTLRCPQKTGRVTYRMLNAPVYGQSRVDPCDTDVKKLIDNRRYTNETGFSYVPMYQLCTKFARRFALYGIGSQETRSCRKFVRIMQLRMQ